MLLEIALNAGSVVLEGAGGVRLPVATGCRRGARRAARSRPHVGPFYGASVYSCSLFVRRSTCGWYRIVIFCLISYHIYRFLLWLYRAITTYLAVFKPITAPATPLKFMTQSLFKIVNTDVYTTLLHTSRCCRKVRSCTIRYTYLQSYQLYHYCRSFRQYFY